MMLRRHPPVPALEAVSDGAAIALPDAGAGIPSALEQLLAKGRLRATLAMLGPAFVAAVAYVDPGNFATNIQGGARYGYLLLWVILAANLMAMLIQYLSAKVGTATGRNLPELCRERYPRPVSWGLWIQAELIAMATDLAEFVGADAVADSGARPGRAPPAAALPAHRRRDRDGRRRPRQHLDAGGRRVAVPRLGADGDRLDPGCSRRLQPARRLGRGACLRARA